ncbi:MAG: hypothetical protein BGO63_02330 [Candidatus Accumulibacter sp. 66-26]|nr:MAG: hypothetical protein BGO63_02330 [Candidatus Accumulibacter sp. 66-26]
MMRRNRAIGMLRRFWLKYESVLMLWKHWMHLKLQRLEGSIRRVNGFARGRTSRRFCRLVEDNAVYLII